MGRQTRTLKPVTALLGALLLLSGCGEPLVVLGDAPGIMRIVLGIGDSIGTRVDSLGVRTRLTMPTAVAFNAENGVLYAGDRGAVRQVSGTTTPVARIFGVASGGRSTLILDAGGCNIGPCILAPTAIALASNGSLIIADQVGNRVLRYVPFGALTVIAGTGTAATAPDGAQASSSPVNMPSGVAVADDGRIFISEAGSHRVRVVGLDGVLGTVAGTGEPGSSGDGGQATSAQLEQPAGLAWIDGSLYIADYLAAVVRRIDPDGSIHRVAGIPHSSGYSGDGGSALDAALDRPVAVAVSPDGRQLYISDQRNNRIRHVSLTSGVIRTFAGTGSAVYSGNRRAAGETSLDGPHGLDASAVGFLFIADPGHSVVWRTTVAID